MKILSQIKAFFGDNNQKHLSELYPVVQKINSYEEVFRALSDEELKKKTSEFRARIKNGETLDLLLPEAFASVRVAAERTLNERHFDVQLLGGIVMHRGGIAEMRTGEGKTLVATLPAYLNALTGKGVHVVTVNDYLSRRDAVWMGQVYALLGLSVGVINHEESFLYDPSHQSSDEERDQRGSFHVFHEFLRPCGRQDAYRADITYGTNNQFGFDYLRDNLAYEESRVVQREPHFAIVDEIDSILIDEARTPLIISAPTKESESLYQTFARIVKNFKVNQDYTVDEKFKSIALTDEGISRAEKALGVENIYTEKGIKYVHHLESAVRAEALFHRDRHYVVKNGEVIIVDEFTGRLQPGRRWSEGLHQAIEAKEGVPVQKESKTFASITFQNYFRMYEKLSGMTGTAVTSSEEFYKVYKLEVVAVPTHKPPLRIDHNDLIFQSEQGKFKAVAEKVRELHQKGQPVLIGTVSIEKNELLAAYLTQQGIPHQVLNAKPEQAEREGEIIAQAGAKGKVTISTNMAGRGVDIKLGGSPPSKESYEEVKRLGGLFVLGTERHEARRIDNQLRGRAGRQGDPGETQFFVSLEDDLMRVFASDTIKKMMGRLGLQDDQAIQNRMITRSLESAQKKIEGFHFDSRKHVLEYDDVLNKQRKTIYEWRRTMLHADSETIDAFIDELSGDDVAYKEVIEKKREAFETVEFLGAVRQVVLQTIDLYWMEHLEIMDYMRSSVNLRAYGQRDPLVEYKKEGIRLFREMEHAIREQLRRLLPNIQSSGFKQDEDSLLLRGFRPKADEILKKTGVIEPTFSRSRATQSIGRNEKVEIEKDGIRQVLKYKKAQDLIAKEGWTLIKTLS